MSRRSFVSIAKLSKMHNWEKGGVYSHNFAICITIVLFNLSNPISISWSYFTNCIQHNIPYFLLPFFVQNMEKNFFVIFDGKKPIFPLLFAFIEWTFVLFSEILCKKHIYSASAAQENTQGNRKHPFPFVGKGCF